MADPYLQIWGGWGLKMFFLWSKNKGGGARPPGPLSWICHCKGSVSSAVVHVFLHVSLRSGKEAPDPTFSLPCHENPASRTSVIAIPNNVFFPKRAVKSASRRRFQDPAFYFGKILDPGNTLPDPVSDGTCSQWLASTLSMATLVVNSDRTM